MTIGLPQALLYHRFGRLWETFFSALGCQVLLSGDTRRETLTAGAGSAVDENCLPLKVYLGHVRALSDRCDLVFVPRHERSGRDEEYCVRFWGLPDLVRNALPGVPLLTCNFDAARPASEAAAFLALGRALGKSPARSLSAYRAGLAAQRAEDMRRLEAQRARLAGPGPKILIAAQPYLIHDPYLGAPALQLIAREGGVPIFSDRCDRAHCRAGARAWSPGLYWSLSREMVGALLLHRHEVDGILLLTAFPCGCDALVNELVMRRMKGVPLVQILLDEHQGQAGLETRIESFLDILQQRRPHPEGA